MSNSATTSPRRKPKAPLIVAGLLLLLCVVLAGSFVWWYVSRLTQSSQVTFTADEVQNLQDAGKQLVIRDAGGASVNPNSGPVLLQRALARPAAPEPDGVYTVGSFQVVRVGTTMARVQPAAAGAPMALVFRQRSWGLIQDAPTFTIARRIVHEAALSKQLAVSNAQMDALNKIVAEPPLKGVYLSALPVPADDMSTAMKAWADYATAQAGTDATAKTQSEQVLIKTIGTVGSVAIAKAKQDYADADNQIKQILTAQQIDAYHQGRAVNP
jgi:hypothetical protein